MEMKQEESFKPGFLRLLIILIPLLALFSALTLISQHSPPPLKKSPLCPFMLIVLPPLENTENSPLHRVSGKTKLPPDNQAHLREAPSSMSVLNKEITAKPNKTPKRKSITHPEKDPSSPWLLDNRFFQSVLADSNTENDPSLELLFYLPLYPTKDKRWLISHTPSSKDRLMPQPPLTVKNPSGNISHLSFKEIQKQFPSPLPLTLQDLLKQFPKQKWFLHLVTDSLKGSVESLTHQKEAHSKFYITSNNEKLLAQFSKKQMAVIYNFRSLLRFQLLRVFLVEKLFSFPGQGLIIPSHLPLSPMTVKKIHHSGQWLFLKKESHIAELPPQNLTQVKGVITREWKPALKWIQDKNPCLQEN
ncbi:MAG: hypothetical protein OXB86_00500 [Bdellovibrionales bacterium]|nr:hypothetical protein [Bdellovibrionales bacterium]